MNGTRVENGDFGPRARGREAGRRRGWGRASVQGSATRNPARARQRVRPRVEQLEPRALPTVNAPWYPSLMAFEHYDSGRTHVFDQAYFGGSFTSGNTVGAQTSRDSFPAGYNAVYENAQQIFVYGGADPSETYGIGSFVARLDPTTLRTVWKTQLEDVRQTGDWNWPGSLSILGDGTLLAIYGYHIARIDPTTGQVLAQAALPTGGWYSQDTVYNGLSGFADGTLVAKTIYRAEGNQQPPTQSVVVAINPSTLQVLSQVTIPDLCGGRISATVYNGQNYAYMTGNASVYRLRWSGGRLTLDTSWSPGSIYLPGQAGGTAPVVVNGWVVFQTDNRPSTTPLSVWAISEANASIRYTIQPFASHRLLPGRSYFDPSAVAADPASGLIYAADWGPGYIGALRITSGGLQVVWTAQQATTEHMALVGPANQRVLVGTDWGGRFNPQTDDVVWRDAATGQVLATSGQLPPILRGDMVQPYYNGAMLYVADDGTLLLLTPAARRAGVEVLGPQVVLASDQPAAVVVIVPEVSGRSGASREVDETAAVRASADGGPESPRVAGESAPLASPSRARILDDVFADPGSSAPWQTAAWETPAWE